MPVAMRKNKDGITLISSSDYSPLCIYLFYCTGINRGQDFILDVYRSRRSGINVHFMDHQI